MDWNQKINDMAGGYKDAAILLNSLRAGIFEALGEDRKTPHEIAEQCDLDPRATDIGVHALAAAGILIKDGDLFSTEPQARPILLADSHYRAGLQANKPEDFRNAANAYGIAIAEETM